MQHPDPDEGNPSIQQPPPPPTKPSFWKRKAGCMPMWLLIVIICVIGLYVFVSIVSAASNGGNGNTDATPTIDATATQQDALNIQATATREAQIQLATIVAAPTDTPPPPPPSPSPTAKPTTESSLAPTYGRPQLGGLISDFIGKYGPPNTTPCPPNNLCWFKDGSSNTEGLIVNKHLSASGYTSQVDWITVQTTNGQVWDASKATDLCTVYIPTDAHQMQRIPLVDASGQSSGYDVVYQSASLSHEFTQDDFNYGSSVSGNVPMGTFDIQYLYKNDGSIDSCSILIGEQQTKG
jgi:hypothetical protein